MWALCEAVFFPLGHGVFPLFSFFFSPFLYVIGGSGVLGHRAVFGFFSLSHFCFLFFVDIGTFSEH